MKYPTVRSVNVVKLLAICMPIILLCVMLMVMMMGNTNSLITMNEYRYQYYSTSSSDAADNPGQIMLDNNGSRTATGAALTYSRDGGNNMDLPIRTCSQQERFTHIRDICKKKILRIDKQHRWKWNKTPLFIVDQEHKLAYCNIPKTGSSTMKTLLMLSTTEGRQLPKPKRSHSDADLYLRGLKLMKYSPKLDSYTKFMVVRNPYERIVSAYNEKIVPYNHVMAYYRTMKRKILHLLKKKSTEQVSFYEFITFLQKKMDKHIVYDPHWDSYVHVCQPCMISYDYVLRTETMAEDFKLILPLLNQTYDILSNVTRNVAKVNKGNITKDMGRQLDYFSDLTKHQIQVLNDLYFNEDILFGYGVQSDNVSYCTIQTETGDECC